MNFDIYHTGVAHDENPPGRGSGRFPYGSGENPGQHQKGFVPTYEKYKRDGMTDKEIAQVMLGVKYTRKDGTPVYYTGAELKAKLALEKKRVREAKVEEARRLYIECDGNVSEVGRKMGINESTVRNLLDDKISANQAKYLGAADMLRRRIAESEIGAVDISAYSEKYAGITAHTKDIAVAMLKEEGYTTMWIQVPQADGKKSTRMEILVRPPKDGETEKDVYREIMNNRYKVASIVDFSNDGGATWWTPEFPESVSSSRVMARYKEDGGSLRDGVIQIRPGVEDLDLGGALYAQCRIAVDGTHYMKGMTMYGDPADFPDGIDIIYNTNKKRGTPLIDPTAEYTPTKDGGTWSGSEVLKRMKIDNNTMEVDQDNPFGALMKAPKEVDGVIMAGGQSHYVGADGKEHLSAINKLREEGDWDSWSRNVASQMLSKQEIGTIRGQIDLTIADKQLEFEQINSLTNPVLRRKMLLDLADQCDASAADLSVRGFKNQSFKVLLPIPSASDKEIYAPNLDNGEIVALVRYPHGGVNEIPILRVNNKIPEALKVMKNAKDAVGINATVAAQLSGADYDGDTALVIPIKSTGLKIKSTEPFADLVNFDPKMYKLPDDAPQVKNETKQLEMGKVTNLITDMSLNDSVTPEEIVRATRHSMVVIDSEKHHLDYKQSYKDNDIEELKYKYQGTTKTGKPAGASTIISRAGAETYINERTEITATYKMTPSELEDWKAGKKVYRETGNTKMKMIKDPEQMTPEELERYNAGKKVFRKTNEPKQIKIQTMYTVDDAYDLVRDPNNKVEMEYAKYANSMKSMAQNARKEARAIETPHVSKAAKEVYAVEADSLKKKAESVELNKPRERKAQLLANAMYDEKLSANPEMDTEHRQRLRAQCMQKARTMTGSKKPDIIFTDREWEAIQSNAISSTTMEKLFMACNQDKLKKLATPKSSNALTPAQIAYIKALKNNPNANYTNKEIADAVGVSVSSVINVK